jgi:hypothetical protein
MNKGIAKERTNSLKNDDSLRFNGPFQNTTTYSTKFPGVSGGNPYVLYCLSLGETDIKSSTIKI